MTALSVSPNEKGTLLVTVGPFTDAAGDTVTPSAVEWRLTDGNGNVVNSRSTVAATPGSTVSILLSGDDLALSTAYVDAVRYLLVTYTYTSSLGAGLVDRVERTFTIAPLVGVS